MEIYEKNKDYRSENIEKNIKKQKNQIFLLYIFIKKYNF